ncbi:SpoIIE family protein phosphatase [Kitasatospora sp. NA04385]|uniref:SpoIIE family protein phosphatase n=1 Tax=Kitasatospora sp. NA04385 TaxID=2742135 RepID=UPI0015912094|nr:SpoIIE family protein phosphatase [Kitasatospora sp. NA04385]QKW17724.1 SpoIIE family protein phosphatase [Kitasatospora sp. NA04385]
MDSPAAPAPAPGPDPAGSPAPVTAAVLLDPSGAVTWWSRTAADLFGARTADLRGRPAAELLGHPLPTGTAPVEGARLRLADGSRCTADLHLLPAGPPGGGALLTITPQPADPAEPRDALLARAVLQQDRIATAYLDRGLRPVRLSAAFDALLVTGLGTGPDGQDWLERLRTPEGVPARAACARAALDGTAVIGVEHRLDEQRVFSLTCFPVDGPDGRPRGVAVVLVELPATAGRARLGLAEAYRRAAEIGGSLDVVGGARELVDVLVPALGDLAAVDFPDTVLQGRDPQLGYPGVQASAPRRVAAKAVEGRWPAPLVQVGEPVPSVSDRPEIAAVAVGGALIFDPDTARYALGGDPRLIAALVPEGMRSAIGCPLYYRGRLFGYVMVWRTTTPEPFDDADVKLVQDLCDRTALALDNAFRYTREHATAVVLQNSLLPPPTTDTTTACESTGAYRPADGTLGVGGDWYDAFPLSSLRTALVIGDVTGHGLQATATMARLRTAVHTLAELDLPPDDLLIRLNDLVQRMAAESDEPDTVGATCLFAVYDPVDRELHTASAGHPPPLLLTPDGTARYLPLDPGPPLGAGDSAYEVHRTVLEPGSLLALYTDGLTGHDPDAAMPGLLTRLPALAPAARPLRAIADDLLAARPAADHPDDDTALLLARTRAVLPQDVLTRRYTDLADVQRARADTGAQLAAWGLDHLAFAAELVVSELVTNAIRYTRGPAVLRLIRDRALVCEVSDPSNTQPRLRRALDSDEGGRGLFLIAQLAERWGCRYAERGKTIWTELALEPRF